MNERTFEDTEFKLHEAITDINHIARDFFATRPDICKAIREEVSNLHDLRNNVEEDDAADRELIRAYGKFFDLVGKQLQTL